MFAMQFYGTLMNKVYSYRVGKIGVFRKPLENYKEAESEIARIVHWYNNERMHSSLNYLTPTQYYRGNPDDLLRIREAKMEKARILRKERNMRERKGGETARVVS